MTSPGNEFPHKSGALILFNRKILVVREYGETIFTLPGGTQINGESPLTTLIRELEEELQLNITENKIYNFGSYLRPKIENKFEHILIHVFLLFLDTVLIRPSHEIEEYHWISSTNTLGYRIAPIFIEILFPKLLELCLID